MSANNNHSPIPVIFLAFANDQVDTTKYLRKLPKELAGIRKELNAARQAGVCEVIERANVTIDDIFDVFQEYRERIAIFHYGGHAGSYHLLLEAHSGKHAKVHSEGLVSFLSKQHGLQLTFINGCCSQLQAEALVNAGIPAVIGTSENIRDDVAQDLAVRFYKGLATKEGLTLENAWVEACDLIFTKKGNDGIRAGGVWHPSESTDRLPWDIYYNPDAAESVRKWSLGQAANNPYWGMPPLPKKYYEELPGAPFVGLNRFTREQAGIFFGRGGQIRELYNRLKNPKHIILFCGQSGVGKSSLLFAGLAPRIEGEFTVQYARRLAGKGLAATLRQALQDALTAYKAEGKKNKSLLEQWQAIEKQLEKPFLLILDQAEEAYTNPLGNKKDGEAEWQLFLNELSTLFPSSGRLLEGKLILSFRKEYYPEISAMFSKQRLGFTSMFLPPMDRAGIIEAVEGVTQKSELREKYRLQIEPPADGNSLAEKVAEDLGSNPERSVAPLLQILLTNLWQQVAEDPEQRIFTFAAYRELEARGLGMQEFLEKQLGKLRTWRRAVVDSGMVLDLLHFHCTELSTAGTRSREEIRQKYGDSKEISELIEKCQNLYLLRSAGKDKPVSLAHDVLAPVVKLRYDKLQSKPEKLVAFFDEQLTALHEQQPAEVDSGLVLDLLQFFCEDATGQQRHSRAEIDSIFGRKSLIDSILARCQKLYLLASYKTGNKTEYFLANTLLQPVILRKYTDSEKPGQRFTRLLEERLRSSRVEENNLYLTFRELRLLKPGKAGRRLLNDVENHLVNNSRARRKRISGIGFISTAILLFVAFFGIQYQLDMDTYREARSEIAPVLVERNYYAKDLYDNGNGFSNSFITYRDSSALTDPTLLPADSTVIYDVASYLYWSLTPSTETMNYAKANDYITQLNSDSVGGYGDWRLPSWEEAMSLMQRDTTAAGLHINSTFSAAPAQIWTGSEITGRHTWRVDFRSGRLDGVSPDNRHQVWAVRSAAARRPFQGQEFAVKAMLVDSNYYGSDYNPGGSGIDREKYHYERQADSQVVYDRKTNLYWQREGSDNGMTISNAAEYINSLNSGNGFGGYKDWRLPTLAEAMSLMAPEKNENGLHIDGIFGARQRWIWTSEQERASRAWTVNFLIGYCGSNVIGYNFYVRAIRSGQSSQ